jgi:flagellar basal body-associated protein FliL
MQSQKKETEMNMMKLFKGRKKGMIALYITFIMIAIVIILLASVFAPMGVMFNTKMYQSGEFMMQKANVTASTISDPTVKAHIQNTIQGATDNIQNNIDINADIFKYSWIIVVGLVAIIIFMYARRIVEVQGIV